MCQMKTDICEVGVSLEGSALLYTYDDRVKKALTPFND